jgi:glutathione S-transferase
MHRMLPAREKRADCALLFARLLQAAVALEGGPLKRHFFWKNAMLKLLIGNKNYSSWSMRPWVLLRQMGIAFEEVGKVPVLQDGDLTVWDTLAIAEYLAERHPELALWPRDRAARARARSVCADMHAGFSALRSHCPMNIEANLAQVGALIWRDQADVRADVARLVSLWQTLLNTYQGPMLFGDFCMADAYFAPVCTRLKTYALPVPPDVAAYVARVLALPGVQAWVNDALAEHDFLAFEEPYRTSRGASR